MGEKKGVNRKVVLGIGVLCIVLLIVVIGVFENQNANIQSQVVSKNSTISALNSKINSLNAEITNLQSLLESENSSNTNLLKQFNSEINNSDTLSSAEKAIAADQQTIAAYKQALATAQQTLTLDQQTSAAEIADLNASVTNLGGEVSSLDQNLLGTGFSIVQITDTQYLSQSYPALENGLTSWVADNSQALNVTMVVHTGDIVNVANSTTQWANANNAMMILRNRGVHYCWCAGNHDQLNKTNEAGGGNPNGSWIGGNYPGFNVTIMRPEPYWIGDIYQGKSTAVRFTYGNYHFMIINIEYNANQTVLVWMQTLIKTNPNVNVIVATHNFLNADDTYGTNNTVDIAWATTFEKLLNNYPNVFMTLNGHAETYGPAGHIRVGNREEIFFNRQEIDSQQGAATARIYTFNMKHPATPNIMVSTYQTYGTPQYLVDPANQFNFSTNLIPYSPSTVSVVSGTDFLGASGYGVSFATSATLQGFSQYGDKLAFNDLTLNGITSNFTVTAVGANIVVSNGNPAGEISYTVSGSGGSQTFSVNTAPVSVYINSNTAPAPVGDGWTYSNGEVTVTGATSQVIINLT